MAAFPHVIIFFLISFTWAPTVFSGMKERDLSKWPPPPCNLYHPKDFLYEGEELECPKITAPVCATNGVTFQNECYFCIARWEFGARFKFDKYGKCDSE